MIIIIIISTPQRALDAVSAVWMSSPSCDGNSHFCLDLATSLLRLRHTTHKTAHQVTRQVLINVGTAWAREAQTSACKFARYICGCKSHHVRGGRREILSTPEHRIAFVSTSIHQAKRTFVHLQKWRSKRERIECCDDVAGKMRIPLFLDGAATPRLRNVG